MVLFLSASLEKILCVLMKAILKQEALEEATAALSLTKVNVVKSSNELEVDQVKLGTVLNQSLSSMESRLEKKRAFKKKCMQIFVAFLQKLQERCPLTYSVIRNASSLLPNSLVEEKEISKMKVQALAERLFKLKCVTADKADDEFVDSECSKHREKFATFDKFSSHS